MSLRFFIIEIQSLKNESFLKLQLLLALGFDLSGDAVEISAALAGELATAERCLLDELQLLQALESFARDSTGRSAEVAGVGAVAFATTENFRHRTDANRAADVDVTNQGGTTDVVPVRVVRSQLLEARRLDDVHPFGDTHLAGSKKNASQKSLIKC